MNTNLSLEDISYLASKQSPAHHSGNDRKSFLAISAGMVWPGFGHLLAGSFKWAGVWFTLWGAIVLSAIGILMEPAFLPATIVLVPLGIAVQFCQLLHAGRCGKRSPFAMLGDSSMRMGVGLVFALIGLGECYEGMSFAQAHYFEICYTPTPSMSPNVSPGDLFVNFKGQPFGRWDIVGVDSPTGSSMEVRHLCKRVVGLPGEKIEITDAGLMVNDKPMSLPEHVGPYLPVDSWNNGLIDAEPMSAANGCWGRPMFLGPDEYFLLGDNTAISDDGRFWPSVQGRQAGATPRSAIHGRIVGIIWPLDRWRVFEPRARDGSR